MKFFKEIWRKIKEPSKVFLIIFYKGEKFDTL